MRFKTFFRENSYGIVKMLVYQVAMTIFGLSVTMAVGAVTADKVVLLCTSIFCIMFHMFLLYTMTWEVGAKDKIRVDGGRMRRDALIGLKMSLFANIPNFALALMLIIGFVFGRSSFMQADWAASLYGVAYLIAWLFESMYTGLINFFAPAESPFGVVALCYLLAVIPSLVTSFAGYYMGLCDRRLIPSTKKPDNK